MISYIIIGLFWLSLLGGLFLEMSNTVARSFYGRVVLLIMLAPYAFGVYNGYYDYDIFILLLVPIAMAIGLKDGINALFGYDVSGYFAIIDGYDFSPFSAALMVLGAGFVGFICGLILSGIFLGMRLEKDKD